jgi:hypothetical protein
MRSGQCLPVEWAPWGPPPWGQVRRLESVDDGRLETTRDRRSGAGAVCRSTGVAGVRGGTGAAGCAVGLWWVVHRPVPGAVGYEYWREGLVNGLAFATVGALVATRRPEHPVGWLFLGAGVVSAVQLVTGEYAAAVLAASGASSAVAVAAWVSYQAQWAVVGVLMTLLVFPTGRPRGAGGWWGGPLLPAWWWAGSDRGSGRLHIRTSPGLRTPSALPPWPRPWGG